MARKPAAAAALVTIVAPLEGGDLGMRHMSTLDGTRLDYHLLAPDGNEATYPVLLALPPGPQTLGAVEWGWSTYYRDAALERGWVVVSPVAPGGRLFIDEARRYLPELLAEVAGTYPPQGGKFHIAGVSNGGLAGFGLAIRHPELFHSLAVLPGWPDPGDLDSVDRLAGIAVRMWAGKNENPGWLDLMRRAERKLRKIDADAELIIMPGEGHTLRRLQGGRALFDFLDAVRDRQSRERSP